MTVTSTAPVSTGTRPELTWQSELFASTQAPATGGGAGCASRLSPRAAFQEVLWGRATLVDIRPEAQRAQEGSPSASLSPVTIERGLLERRLDPRSAARLPIASPDLRVIVLCQEGWLSPAAAAALARLGVRHAADVIGGFAAWRSLGLPVAA